VIVVVMESYRSTSLHGRSVWYENGCILCDVIGLLPEFHNPT